MNPRRRPVSSSIKILQKLKIKWGNQSRETLSHLGNEEKCLAANIEKLEKKLQVKDETKSEIDRFT